MAALSVTPVGAIVVNFDLHTENLRIPGVKACESLWRRRGTTVALEDYPVCGHERVYTNVPTGPWHPVTSALGMQSLGPVSTWK